MLLTKAVSNYSYNHKISKASSVDQDWFTWILERKWSNFARGQKDTVQPGNGEKNKKYKLRETGLEYSVHGRDWIRRNSTDGEWSAVFLNLELS